MTFSRFEYAHLLLLMSCLFSVDNRVSSKSTNNEASAAIDVRTSMENCQECQMILVETIPIGVEDNLNHMTTVDSWKQLISMAKTSIEIGSFYWTLQDPHETADQGREIFELLKAAGTTGNIKIRITKDLDSASFPNIDTKDLEEAGAAVVRSVNFTRLLDAGLLHTKMWVVDRKHIYIGSSNFDWRAMTQVKEIGVMATNCSCLGEDLGKAFDIYWELGQPDSTIPEEGWGPEYEPEHNKDHPMEIPVDGITYNTYIASSPPQLCPKTRTGDIDAIYDVIDHADEFVHIAVMDYFPLMLYLREIQYWPDLENRLKETAINRRVKIRLLMAKWPQTRANAVKFLKSLEDVHNSYSWVDIQVKMYEVESTEDQLLIEFARVNHNKYVVTDKSAYIGTSNWSGDYFTSTAGVSIVITPTNSSTPTNPNNLRTQLENVFARDWNSKYAHELSHYDDGKNGNSAAAELNNSLVHIGCIALGVVALLCPNI